MDSIMPEPNLRRFEKISFMACWNAEHLAGHGHNSSDWALISVRLWNFKDGGSLKARFLAKNQHTKKKLLYFINTMIYGWSKSAKIVLSKSIFCVKNQLIFFKKNFIEEYFFSNFPFWTILFSKIMPNFWRTDIHW